MMTKNTGMFYGYNPGFIPQQPMNPAMFKNHWKFQQNQGNPAVQQQQQQSNDVNAQFWTLIFENKENGSRLYIQITDGKMVNEAYSVYREKNFRYELFTIKIQ